MQINSLKKFLLSRVFKNSKCKEQKKFKVDAYLDWFEFELFDATKQLGDFQHPVKQFAHNRYIAELFLFYSPILAIFGIDCYISKNKEFLKWNYQAKKPSC